MRLAKYMMTAAVATFAAAPVLAAPANPAASLSVAKSVRASGAVTAKNDAMGGGIVVAVLAAAAVIAGIVIIAQEDDDSDSD